MKLTDFQKKYNHHINTNLSFYILSKLRETTHFDFDVYLPTKGKNLQRGLVWSIEQKRSLILSILRDQKIPNMVVVQDENKDKSFYYWKVIDGKQRLTTFFDFIDGKFSIVWKDKEYYINDLPEDCKKHIMLFDNYTISVHYNYNNIITDDVLISLFEDLNWLGTPQDIEHLNELKK